MTSRVTVPTMPPIDDPRVTVNLSETFQISLVQWAGAHCPPLIVYTVPLSGVDQRMGWTEFSHDSVINFPRSCISTRKRDTITTPANWGVGGCTVKRRVRGTLAGVPHSLDMTNEMTAWTLVPTGRCD